MLTYDLSPFFFHSDGSDTIQRRFDNNLSLRQDSENNYPTYNIETIDDDNYRVTIAIAGFDKKDLDIVTKGNTLSIKGNIKSKEDKTYIHQGVAGRSFERNFSLEDDVKVTDANLENGLLHIDLIREIPEAKKLRKIKIKSGLTLPLAETAQKLDNGEKKVAA
jgi:molecular chaperone IbpA